MRPEDFELKDIKLFEKFIKKYKEEKSFTTHHQAWCSHVVKATDKKGNYIYKRFEDFYAPGDKNTSTLSSNEYKKIQNILEKLKEPTNV